MPPLGDRLRACLPKLLSSSTSSGSIVSTTTSTSLTFQYVSDLHLEYCSQYTAFKLPANAANLILAGNIGHLADYGLYLDFLANLAPRFKGILLVIGATELHGLGWKEGRQLADRLISEPALRGRVKLLDQTRLELDANTTVLGCTLFSAIDTQGFSSVTSTASTRRGKANSIAQLSDWSAEAQVKAHTAQKDWLEHEVRSLRAEKGSGHNVLVVTSTAPICCFQRVPTDDKSAVSLKSFSSLSSLPLSVQPSLSYSNETQLLGLDSALDHATCWVFGSNGAVLDANFAGVRLLSNQRGLVAPFEDANTAFTREIGPGRGRGRGLGARSKSSKMVTAFDVGRTFRI